jgi:hypothetical protein
MYLEDEYSELLNKRNGLPGDAISWTLFEANAKAIASGPNLPNEDDLHKALAQSATRTKADILRRFVRAHPSHHGAKVSFLQELKRLAEEKTKEKIGQDAGVDKSKLLSGEDDEAIWGEYASNLSSMFTDILAKNNSGNASEATDISFFSRHSPKMKALASLMLPNVEAALRRQPTSISLWGLWFRMAILTEKPDFKTFRGTLALSPHSDTLDAPPQFTRWMEGSYLMERAEWQMLIDMFSWQLETIRTALDQNPARMQAGLWVKGFEYLLEAYLRLDKDSEANALVNYWKTSPAFRALKQGMVDLAKKCGKNALAEQWEKL